MVVDVPEGFKPDKRPKSVVRLLGVLFFLTSAYLAVMMLPTILSDDLVQVNEGRIQPPVEQDAKAIAWFAAGFVAWMLAAFAMSMYVMRLMKMGAYLGVVLVGVTIWQFPNIGFPFAGKILLLVVWILGLGGVCYYWNNLS
ncbi:MAG: hypothetical protein OXR66_06370 [Candidatus Woesearchaeota archaeon]|nr:hypothetical protein [Candidatus Woesearchaeota archaeon]